MECSRRFGSGVVSLVAVLPCTISKPIHRRILVSKTLLERLFGHVNHLHLLSIDNAHEDDKKFIANRTPAIEISYKDGTDYEIRDLSTLHEVIPGKGKEIDYIKLHSRVGDFTCEIELKTYAPYDAVTIRASGLEDKIGHFVDTLVAELTNETDITVFARRVWGGVWTLVFSLLIWLTISWDEVNSWQTAFILGMLVMITTIFLSIPVELFRRKWLPPVAFLWGRDGLRAKQAKVGVTVLMASIPLGVVVNGISALFFG